MKRKAINLRIPAWLANSHVADRWLAGFAIACLTILGAELLLPHRLETAVETGGTESVGTDPSRESRPPKALDDYRAITDRPLFSFDRRLFVPPPPEPAVPPPPAGPRVEFELSAVVTSATTRMAFLKTNLSPEVGKVAVDQSIAGWTLAEVHDDAVVLRNGAEERTVELQAERAGGARSGSARSGSARRMSGSRVDARARER
jgi:hypothetical protein